VRFAPLLLAVSIAATACTRTVLVERSPGPASSPAVSAPPGSKYLEAHGVRFAYPGTWRVLSAGAAPGDATIDLTVSPDDESFVRLQRFHLLINVSQDRLPDVKPQLARSLRQTAARVGGRVTQPLSEMPTAGFPGYLARLSVTTTRDRPGEEDVYIFFDETNEYTLACESTTETRNEVQAACELARSTFAAPHPLPPQPTPST
jgi:hypothetical protein